MIEYATHKLMETAGDPAAPDDDLQFAAQELFGALGGCDVDQANETMRTLAGGFDLEDASRAAFLALVCGAMVERGCDPAAIAEPLTGRLERLLRLAAELAEKCAARLPDSPGEDDEEDEDADLEAAFETARQQLAASMPRHDNAWTGLNLFWRPAIAVYSRSGQARAAASRLRETAGAIAGCHEAGHWLQMMLGVLDDEPLLALEPATGQGLVGSMSGVVDNFQLNVLLMDAFPHDGPPQRRVSEEAASIAKGIGPQQSDEVVTGVWNLYTWKALRPDLTLPDAGDYSANALWIWNEGSPEDIPVFEDYRVVLLGPPTYERNWRSQRMFAALPAGLEVRALSSAEAKDWLERIAAANG